jgi:uncharacterized integral membrane protein
MCAFSFLIRALRISFTQNRIPLLKEPLRQLLDVFWVVNQVANLNSTHIDPMFCLNNQAEPPRTLEFGSTLSKAYNELLGSLQHLVSLCFQVLPLSSALESSPPGFLLGRASSSILHGSLHKWSQISSST